jgi:hypothetical protein
MALLPAMLSAPPGSPPPAAAHYPDWSPKTALALMDDVGTATGIVSVSTPGTGLFDARPPLTPQGLA